MSYDAFASTFSASRKNLRWGEIEYFVEYIKIHFSQEKISLLDVGCGNGRFIEALEIWEFPSSYIGIDESHGMITEAKALHPDYSFRVLDMNHLEELSEQKTYDVIVFIASFHHICTIQDRKKILKRTKKLLSPGGIVMMTNWNLLGEELFQKYEASHKWDGDFGIKIGAHDRYYHGFTLKELQELFEQSGFTLIENRVFEGGKNIISIISW